MDTPRTSRPTPAAFAQVYRELFAAGYTGICSVHLSAALSGTIDSARLAAREYDPMVTVCDSRAVAMAQGFVVLAAASAAQAGGDLETVAAAATAASHRSQVLFVVESLEQLRRGGRIGAAATLLGTALAIKPVLQINDGVVAVRDRVRTTARARARLVELVGDIARISPIDLAVQHVSAQREAEQLADALQNRLGDRLRRRLVLPAGPAVAAHVGAGALGVATYQLPVG